MASTTTTLDMNNTDDDSGDALPENLRPFQKTVNRTGLTIDPNAPEASDSSDERENGRVGGGGDGGGGLRARRPEAQS